MKSVHNILEAEAREGTAALAHRRAQLEEQSRQLESFRYSVSHGLLAPLRAISGFAHMGRLIEDLLTYSRLGESEIILKSVALSEVLNPVIRNLEPRAKELGVRMEVAADFPNVLGDRTLLSQIFSNLLDNAITYRRCDLPGVVTLSWKEDGIKVVVSVSDNGIGIDPANFDRIFETFQRLHTQEQYPGTGMGLAIVLTATRLQHGAVRVESTLGTGSTFHITLEGAPSIAPNAPAARV
jgi:light-regulated signal transduction histidine kinase (bacteriophytochrome)